MIVEISIGSKWEINPEVIEKAYSIASQVQQEVAKKQKQIAQEILSALAKRA